MPAAIHGLPVCRHRQHAGRWDSGLENKVTTRQILLGNEAIAHGLLESACTMATSYPGTPASEVLGALVKLKKQHDLKLHLEWSVNEKVAFEVALANSFAGRRSAVIMKQVGLNVAADPLMSAAYTGVKGGFVVVVADDPGPHSSQTEQDSRFLAMAAKLPVLDPSSPAEARDFIDRAMRLSEKYEIPVILRPTTRVCHARQDMELRPFAENDQVPLFEKDPARWAATPKFRLLLHRRLNEKLAKDRPRPRIQPILVESGRNRAFLPAAAAELHRGFRCGPCLRPGNPSRPGALGQDTGLQGAHALPSCARFPRRSARAL